MKAMNKFLAIALALGLSLASGTLACERDGGTLENAGEKADDVVDDITHPGEGPVEEAARKTGEQIDEVKEDLEE